jgi:hypothetical protein
MIKLISHLQLDCTGTIVNVKSDKVPQQRLLFSKKKKKEKKSKGIPIIGRGGL